MQYRLITPLAVALFALLPAACGGTHSAPTGTRPRIDAALASVRRAAAETLTQKVVISVALANTGDRAWPVVSGSGSFDLREATGAVRVRNPRGFESVVFQPAGVFDRPPPGGDVSLPKGRPWIRADYEDGLILDGAPPFLLACESADVGFFLAEVAWGARTAVPLGRKVVDHAPATGYLVRVDIPQAAAAATGPRAQGFVRLAKLLERIGRGGSRRLSDQIVRVWVDHSGRVVAVRGSLPLSGIGHTAMTVTRFGAIAAHPAPVRGQVVDLETFMDAGGHGGG